MPSEGFRGGLRVAAASATGHKVAEREGWGVLVGDVLKARRAGGGDGADSNMRALSFSRKGWAGVFWTRERSSSVVAMARRRQSSIGSGEVERFGEGKRLRVAEAVEVKAAGELALFGMPPTGLRSARMRCAAGRR
jgi:hypothetical protein